MKNMMLTQILEQNARARCESKRRELCSLINNNNYAVNSIALVKPERARQVEGMLIQMAQSGQIGGKVGLLVHA